MNAIKSMVVNTATAILLFSFVGCTVIGAGIGAVAGSGTTAGVVGGAVIGGVVGYEISK